MFEREWYREDALKKLWIFNEKKLANEKDKSKQENLKSDKHSNK